MERTYVYQHRVFNNILYVLTYIYLIINIYNMVRSLQQFTQITYSGEMVSCVYTNEDLGRVVDEHSSTLRKLFVWLQPWSPTVWTSSSSRAATAKPLWCGPISSSNVFSISIKKKTNRSIGKYSMHIRMYEEDDFCKSVNFCSSLNCKYKFFPPPLLTQVSTCNRNSK